MHSHRIESYGVQAATGNIVRHPSAPRAQREFEYPGHDLESSCVLMTIWSSTHLPIKLFTRTSSVSLGRNGLKEPTHRKRRTSA